MRKQYGIDPILKWEILRRAPIYKPGAYNCKLCSEEKFAIVTFKAPDDLLNQRKEILNKCAHRRSSLLYVVK